MSPAFASRLLGETSTWAGGGGAQQVVRHYGDGSDNPSSVTTTTSGGVSTSRVVELGGEGLDLRVTVSAGQVAAELMVASPRGDVVSTIEVDAQGSPEGLSGWSSFDEHGNPVDQPAAASSSSGGVVYGWLGAHQRATTAVGLTLMGARVHNPVTGLFTTVDPVHGGGDTIYAYPNDPINHTDLDGLTSKKKMNKREIILCGVSPKRCAIYLEVSAWAHATAEALYGRGGDSDKKNAFRHIIWQAILLKRLGSKWAIAWANAHENGATSADHRADMRNNLTGRQLGAQLRGGDWYSRSKIVITARRYIREGRYARR